MSNQERELFLNMQLEMRRQLTEVFPDPFAPRSVVINPSLSLNQEELLKITGAHHYEERMLCMLMLLRFPNTQLVYLTSQLLDPAVIDYHLHLLSGVPSSHARDRLVFLDCGDASKKPLTEKLLERPRMLQRIRENIRYPEAAHLSVFNAREEERQLALRLKLPLHACDPDLLELGGKSGSRRIFREAEVPMPFGFEDLSDEKDIVDAIVQLKQERPSATKVVVKLNYGFSGEGNAVVPIEDCPIDRSATEFVRKELPSRIRFESEQENWEQYKVKFKEMGGIVEEFLIGDGKQSPSVQLRVNGDRTVSPISTHDQVLGGPSGQIFKGCYFPADNAYRTAIQEASLRIGEVLSAKGVLARFGVDFVSIPQSGGGWNNFAIEINLRKGGTTHPFMMLDYLADGHYEESTGEYITPSGQSRCYFASDNLRNDRYRGLTAHDLIDIAVQHRLHFHGATQEGTVFHLIGALSEYGKLGIECIAKSRFEADGLYTKAVQALNIETGVADV